MNGTGSSSLDLSGLTAGSRFNLVLSPVTGFGNPSGTPLTYNLANFAGGVTPPVGIIGNDLTPYFNVTGGFVSVPTVTLAGTIVQVGFQPVPEPVHIVAAAAVAGLALVGWRRRRARLVVQQV
jgi:MYXO-CTERM domain-containing protein